MLLCFSFYTSVLRRPIDYLPFSFAVLARDLFRFILSPLPFLFLISLCTPLLLLQLRACMEF